MSNRSTKLLVFGLLFVAGFSARGQYYYYNNHYYDKDLIWEVGASVGLMTGVTDVGGTKGLPSFKSSRGNGSAYIGVLYQNLVGARLEATLGMITGADSNVSSLKPRNLSYKSTINEIALIGEFHPLTLKYRDEPLPFSPYIALGLGWFSFNPQALLNGRWVDLRPLRTEGQGFPETASLQKDTRPYNLSQSNIIMGLGLKYELSQFITLRGEFLYRATFTDYLDDVSTFYIDPTWFDNNLSATNAALAKQLYDRSNLKPSVGSQRGNPKVNDAYFTINFKIAVTLGRQKID